VKEAAENGIMAICGYAGCEVVELNVQKLFKAATISISRHLKTQKLSISDAVRSKDFTELIKEEISVSRHWTLAGRPVGLHLTSDLPVPRFVRAWEPVCKRRQWHILAEDNRKI
jgi:hypothetical protein